MSERFAVRQLDDLSAFLIEPGCRHRAIGDRAALLVSQPAADDTDEYLDA
ncbi:hypothetical protein [Micromonospora sp. NPDC049645]